MNPVALCVLLLVLSVASGALLLCAAWEHMAAAEFDAIADHQDAMRALDPEPNR